MSISFLDVKKKRLPSLYDSRTVSFADHDSDIFSSERFIAGFSHSLPLSTFEQLEFALILVDPAIREVFVCSTARRALVFAIVSASLTSS